jgi:hypothetical protein
MSEKPEEKLDIQKIIEENNELKKREKQLLKALGDMALDNQILSSFFLSGLLTQIFSVEFSTFLPG